MNQIKQKAIINTHKTYYNIFKSQFSHNIPLPSDFTVTSHAGSFFTKPNTIESIETAVEWGADIVEFDVSFRPDGTAVIIHDSSPAQNQGVLLDDALSVVAKDKKCRINLDIKSTANLPEVDRLVNKHGLFERVFYTGVFEDWVDAVKSTSAIPYYLNHNITETEANDKKSTLEIIEKTKNLGAIGINSQYKFATKDFCKLAHENGILVSLWTVNKPAEMKKVLETAPDNITTKKPDILKLISKR